MNLENDNIFQKELDKLNLILDDFEHFLEFFGSKCENSMPEEMDLKKTFILQETVIKKASKLEMCIGTYV